MTTTTEKDWDPKLWSQLERCVIKDPDKYKSDFLEWLSSKPLLWDRLVTNLIREPIINDPNGFSILTIILTVYLDSTDSDPEYLQKVEFTFARDIGRLLIDLFPEVAECLWKGEFFAVSMKHEYTELAECIEGSYPDLKRFFLTGDDDPYNNPEYMVFPELKKCTGVNTLDGETAH